MGSGTARTSLELIWDADVIGNGLIFHATVLALTGTYLRARGGSANTCRGNISSDYFGQAGYEEAFVVPRR